jgi:hypothetical protein
VNEVSKPKDVKVSFLSGTLWVGRNGYDIDFDTRVLKPGAYVDVNGKGFHVISVGYYLNKTHILHSERLNHGPHVTAVAATITDEDWPKPGDVR